MNSDQKYLEAAVSAAAAAGKIFKQNFGRPKSVTMKNNDPRDLVTEIDKKIETQIRKTLLKKFPGHKFIGEEFGLSELTKNDLVWIIDHIDGTTNYIHGVPICCISLALWDSRGPVVATVYNPVAGYLFSAAKNRGAFLNGKKIRVSKEPRLRHAFGGFGWGRNIHKAQVNFPKLVNLLHKIRTLGSSTSELCFVAMGVFDFHIQSEINIWDFAAAALIIKEAGGKITEQNGKAISLTSKSVIASNGKIHKGLIDEFRKSVIL